MVKDSVVNIIYIMFFTLSEVGGFYVLWLFLVEECSILHTEIW
jgi:hypothetical protein